LTVGYFSPLPPTRSGVADYAAALLAELRKFGQFHVNASNSSVALYHLGNNLLHRGIYSQALRRPGVVVLHDALLQHFFLGSLTEREYCDEFAYNYGEWSRAEAHTLWKNRAKSADSAEYFARPMLKRIVECSRAIIVHNPAARARVLDAVPQAQVVEIPHFFKPVPPPDATELLLFRGRCRYLFGIFGYLRESKRLFSALKTFSRLRRIMPGVELLVAGQFHSPDLAASLAPLLSAPGVRRIGHMSDAEFALATAAVDCCVNLRYPSAAETSGIGIRLMGLGKPVIFTEGPENSHLPAHTHLAVEPGLRESAHLFELMATLVAKPLRGIEVGHFAAAHILRYHSIQAAAEQYWRILCDTCS
jgi:glycosyltransferase involved in cell wall biosynthesis